MPLALFAKQMPLALFAKQMLGCIPEDILKVILSFYSKDVYTISKLSECNKHLLNLCRKKWVWVDYYRSLFPENKRITKDSIHIGDCSYFRCRIGDYPGWNNVYDTITDKVCCIPEHYVNTKVLYKQVKWKNLFKMCAVRTHTLNKHKHNWLPRDENKLGYLKAEIVRLSRKKDRYKKFKSKFKPFINYYDSGEDSDEEVVFNNYKNKKVVNILEQRFRNYSGMIDSSSSSESESSIE